MAWLISSPVSRAMPKAPEPSPAATSSDVCPATASSKSCTTPAPFRARPVTRPRSMRSTITGESPTLRTCAPSPQTIGLAARVRAPDVRDQRAQGDAAQEARQALQERRHRRARGVRPREVGEASPCSAGSPARTCGRRPGRAAGPRAGACAPSAGDRLLDDLAEEMDDEGVDFLDARRRVMRHVDEVVDQSAQRAPALSGQGRP